MDVYGQKCQLCGLGGLDLNGGKGDELTEKDYLETFKFLSVGNTPTDYEKRCVCQTCSAKIRLISSLRSESIKVQNETSEGEPTKNEQEHEADADDEDFEELNQLSLFYAEHDNVEKDPDFDPGIVKKAIKRPNKRPHRYISETPTLPDTSTQNTHEGKIQCQICQNDNKHFTRLLHN